MNSSSSQHNASDNSLWEWISTGEFRLPPASIQTSFKTRVLSLLQGYKKKPAENLREILSKEKLETLSDSDLRRIAPSIDWKAHARSLDPVLMPWCKAPGSQFVAILNLPHSGNTEMLKYWAADHGFPIIEPPPPQDLLKSDDAWFGQFKTSETCWVLPAMEHCYLRHESGLARIRLFFERLSAGQLGNGILGCGSWAWSFFNQTLGVSAPLSMVVKPFDSEKLTAWLGGLAFGNSGRQLVFRQSDSGRPILSSESKPADPPVADKDQDPFLRDLAAFSLGIPGVVIDYWRASLQMGPDKLDLEKNDQETAAGGRTIWVKPWINVEKPRLPEKAGRHHAFILHSLLLHDTLDPETLSKLQPMSQHHFAQTLYDLSDKGMIECTNNQWRVSPKGYPVVRGFLKNEGFLTDDFK